MSDRTRELARTYLRLLTPGMRQAVELAGSQFASVFEGLDWSIIVEPLVDPIARVLTEEELARAIAWTETDLYAKLNDLQPTIAREVQVGLLAAIVDRGELCHDLPEKP